MGVVATFRFLGDGGCIAEVDFRAMAETPVLALVLGGALAAVSAASMVIASGVRSSGLIWVVWRQMVSISGPQADSVEGGGASDRWGLPVSSS